MGKLEHPFKKCVKFYTLVVEEHRRQALVVIIYDYITAVNFMHFISPPHTYQISLWVLLTLGVSFLVASLNAAGGSTVIPLPFAFSYRFTFHLLPIPYKISMLCDPLCFWGSWIVV
jgi:hypothetical protein